MQRDERAIAALQWTDWVPLTDALRTPAVPRVGGLYRIRRIGFSAIDYIGQTGSGTMTLPKRLAMLRGIYADEMPYNDPHTAAPGLWALRHQSSCAFEVSVCPVEGKSDQWRKGLECLAIAIYRQETRQSPTINFGRMPVGYRKSSGNTAALVAAGKRYRGGLVDESLPNHLPGVSPLSTLDGNPQASDWCGHQWSVWRDVYAVDALPPREANGLYRLRGRETEGLVYVGEGSITSRIKAHMTKGRDPSSRQGPIFSASPLDVSWTVGSWTVNQRLELETDLIGAHMSATSKPPTAQFFNR